MSASHHLVVVNVNLDPRTVEGCEAIRSRLLELEPGLEISIVAWRDVEHAEAALERAVAVVLGPNESPFPAYPSEFRHFLAWVKSRNEATLGICGGHQVLGLAHGALVAPVYDIPAATATYEGMRGIKGDVQVRLRNVNDPIVANLPKEFRVTASHVDEVKGLPPGFRLLGRGAPSLIQMMRAEALPIYGMQFHPERSGDGEPGTMLLRNWLMSLQV